MQQKTFNTKPLVQEGQDAVQAERHPSHAGQEQDDKGMEFQMGCKERYPGTVHDNIHIHDIHDKLRQFLKTFFILA